ncbi:MAG: Hsp20/alpha crystallin family protein [Armatimonadota bacterium]
MADNKTPPRVKSDGLATRSSFSPVLDIERMFEDMFSRFLNTTQAPLRLFDGFEKRFKPEVDLKETEKEFILEASIPGMDKDDINIDVTRDSITISGEKRSEEEKPGEKYHIKQQSSGSFSVYYTFPGGIKPDETKATYKDGVLTVELPKAEVQEKHKIKIGTK